jgi:lysophospholipase L1-like esterase
MRFRFAEDVLALAPKEVVIQAGINDLVAGLIADRRAEAREQTVANLVALAEAASAGGASVILTTIIRPAAPRLSQELLLFSAAALASDVAAVNARLRALSAANLKVIDVDSLLAGSAAALPSEFATDLVHLTSAAYARMNAAIATALEQ